MSMTRRWILLGLGAGSVTSATSALAWFETRHRELSQAPLRVAEPLAITPTASLIGIKFEVPYQFVSNKLTAAIPANARLQGRVSFSVNVSRQMQKTIRERVGGDVGKVLGDVVRFATRVVTFNTLETVSEAIDYDVTIVRAGPVTVEKAGNGIRLTLVVRADGHISNNGEIAKLMRASKKNVRAAVRAIVDLEMDVDANWRPILKAKARYEWIDPAKIEVIHKTWLDISDKIGPEIQKFLDSSIEKARASLEPEMVKNAVRPYWRQHTIPIQVATEPAYLIIKPDAAHFSGVSYGPSALQFALALGASTEITMAPTDGAIPASLPALQRIALQGTPLRLNVPIQIPYDDATRIAARQLIGSVHQGMTPFGHAKVTVKAIEIYPSGGQIAVALRFSAAMKSKLFDANGTVYLTGTPLVDEQNQVLSFRDLRVTRELDNGAWTALSIIFNDQIAKAIEGQAIVDLRPQLEVVRARLREKLSQITLENIKFGLNETFLGLRSVAPSDRHLSVLVAFEGSAEAVVS